MMTKDRNSCPGGTFARPTGPGTQPPYPRQGFGTFLAESDGALYHTDSRPAARNVPKPGPGVVIGGEGAKVPPWSAGSLKPHRFIS